MSFEVLANNDHIVRQNIGSHSAVLFAVNDITFQIFGGDLIERAPFKTLGEPIEHGFALPVRVGLFQSFNLAQEFVDRRLKG